MDLRCKEKFPVQWVESGEIRMHEKPGIEWGPPQSLQYVEADAFKIPKHTFKILNFDVSIYIHAKVVTPPFPVIHFRPDLLSRCLRLEPFDLSPDHFII